jgi:hypothetical protein
VWKALVLGLTGAAAAAIRPSTAQRTAPTFATRPSTVQAAEPRHHAATRPPTAPPRPATAAPAAEFHSNNTAAASFPPTAVELEAAAAAAVPLQRQRTVLGPAGAGSGPPIDRAATRFETFKAWPGRYCSPRHSMRMPINSRNEGSSACR